jgi:hypothetical protein
MSCEKFPTSLGAKEQPANQTVIVLPNERAQYSALIDNILASSDLQTISAKQIRKQLQAALDVDISEKKVSFCPPGTYAQLYIHMPSQN